jgi:predicted  nucleic acid-binding Zn-ribbon protein
MSVLGQLYQLQRVDSEADGRSHRLAEVKARLGISRDVVQARSDVKEMQSELDGLVKAMRALDLEVGAVDAKLKANQSRLYSGKVQSPRELSGLQEEAGALRRRLSELEDDQLELMIGEEEQQAELAERQARLIQIETNWRASQAGLKAEKEDLEFRLLELEEQRSELRSAMGAADLTNYDWLRQRLGGRAIALLKGGICQVCGVDVPTGVASEVMRGSARHSCPTCTRILYGGG